MVTGTEDVSFDVLTVAVKRSSVSWDIMLCIPLKINILVAESLLLLHAGFLHGIFFSSKDWGNMFLWNVDFQQTKQHYVPEDGTHFSTKGLLGLLLWLMMKCATEWHLMLFVLLRYFFKLQKVFSQFVSKYVFNTLVTGKLEYNLYIMKRRLNWFL